MPDPTLPIILDLKKPAREFRLRIPAGTQPVIAVTLLDGGAAFDPTGWTAHLFHFVDFDAIEMVAVDQDGVAVANVVYLPFSAAESSVVGLRYASVLIEKAGRFQEAGRGQIEFVGSPPTMGATPETLSTLVIAEGWQLVVDENGQVSAQPIA